jgi:arylsulfatase
MKQRNNFAALTGIAGIAALAGIHSCVVKPDSQDLAQQTAFEGVINKRFEESKQVPIVHPNPAAGKPNVVWILLDDVGFGASSAFGGLIRTPNFDQLADNGLRFTNFHTTGISAPTRAALLTGRNHHRVHMGGFPHDGTAQGFPGWDGRIPNETGTIAETLKEYGYNTFAVGKYHLVPDEEATDTGPFDRWPTGKGFEKYFGFLSGQSDQYNIKLVEDNNFIKPDGRHFSEQITDKAIDYITKQKTAAPDKPFFLYYAPGATHAPHQVDKKWSEPYKGTFDEGWDVYREKVFAQQKQLGIIPADAVLPDRNPLIQPWEELSDGEKTLYARFFENYAGYLTYTDYEVGRVIQTLKDLNQLDNTIIFVVIGDNGASKEGDFVGIIESSNFNFFGGGKSLEDATKENLKQIDLIGTPEGTGVNYPLGWAQAANTPFRNWKQDAHSEGGTRNPLIVHYPKGVTEKGGIRNQYSHVIDLFPTTIELLELPEVEQIKGSRQLPLQGSSLVYSINNKPAASTHTTQYYFIYGNGGIYDNGWKATFAYHPDIIDLRLLTLKDKSAVASLLTAPYGEPEWELYNLNEDFTERINLADKNPERLAELKELFEIQAQENNIYPLINWIDILKANIHRGILKGGQAK